MEELKECPCCDGQKIELFLTCTDHLISTTDFNIVKCLSCGFLFTNPRPSIDDSGKFYQSDEYISHSNSKKGLFNSLYQMVRKRTIHAKVKLLKKHAKVGNLLDIGCGTGEFLAACKLAGWQTQGMEPSDSARNFAIEKHGLNIYEAYDFKQFTDNSLNCITLWHVLEHIHQLNEYLTQIKRILKTDGILIIALPNPNSWDAKKYGKFWAAYDVPRHIYHFTFDTLNRFLQNYKFKILEVLPMKFDSYYVSMLSEKNKNGKINWFSAIKNGWISNRNSKKTKNTCSSQIYIVKNSKIN